MSVRARSRSLGIRSAVENGDRHVEEISRVLIRPTIYTTCSTKPRLFLSNSSKRGISKRLPSTSMINSR